MSDPSDTPRILGPYRLETLLGRGGMGEVWAARDSRLDRRVAVKHVRTHPGDTTDAAKVRARFRREAWAAAKVTHPAIVPVFDVLEDASGDWIVMELVDGPTLRDRIDGHGPLSIETAVRFGRQIAEGLAAAHREGLVHRDLKTENVMIAPSGHVKILDFGLAKAQSKPEGEATITVSGEVMGTVRCMSPEQARGFDVDARSDLFSLGTLLYEALTGTSPFRGATPLDTLSRVVTWEPEPIAALRPEVPDELSVLVERLLQKDPGRRPQTADEVATALRVIDRSRDESTTATTTPPSWEADTLTDDSGTGSFGPASRGRSWLPIAAAVAALTTIGLALGWFLGRDGRTDSAPPSVESRPTSLVDVDPQSFTTAYDAFVHGQKLLDRYDRKGHLPAAIEAFRRAIALDGEHAAAFAGLARALWLEYETRTDRMWLDQATQAARRAVALDEHLVAALTSSALVAVEHGEMESARGHADTATTIDPSNADAHYVSGIVAAKAGDTAAAVAAFGRAIELDDQRSQFFDELGLAHLRSGQLDDAEQAFSRSVELNGDNIYSRRNLAVVHQMSGRYDEAAAQLQKALEIRPSATLYGNLGTLLFFQGLYESAAEAYEKALDFEGAAQQAPMWANLGDAYRFLPGSEDRARQAFEHAIRLIGRKIDAAPDDANSRTRRATYLAKIERCSEALEDIDTAAPATKPRGQMRLLYRQLLVEELCDRRDDALETLVALLAAGYSPASIETDPELLTLRSDRRFQAILTAALDT